MQKNKIKIEELLNEFPSMCSGPGIYIWLNIYHLIHKTPFIIQIGSL